jgi:hypothetical protein
MKTHTIDNYLNLIQNLLDCPQGDEGELLQQSKELINPELLQVMEGAIKELVTDGNLESANYLRYWQTQLAHFLQQETKSSLNINGKSRAYLNLIQALLRCPEGLESELLEVNKDLIDSGLVEMMRQIAAQTRERGDSDTANYLNNLATEIAQNWLESNLFSSEKPKKDDQTNLGVKDLVSPEDPWIQDNIPSELPTKQEELSQQNERETLNQKISDIDVSANDSLANSSEDNNSQIYSELETLNNQKIKEHLNEIARSLANLEKIITRLQPANPLWYMEILEQAHASHWILSTEEIEKLIGVKPKCEPGKNSYQRGCWLFVKAGKMGAQTAWHIIKQNEDFNLN